MKGWLPTLALLCFFCGGCALGLLPAHAQTTELEVAVTNLRTDYEGGASARSVVRRCETLSRRFPSPQAADVQAKLYSIWGNALAEWGNRDSLRSAKAKHETALRLRQAFYSAHSAEAARSWSNIGLVCMALSDPKAALTAYQTAWAIDSALFPSDDPNLLPIVQNFGDFYHQTRDLPKAISWWVKGLAIAEHHQPAEIPIFLLALGSAHLALSNPHAAEGYLGRAVALSSEPCSRATLLSLLGQAYEQTGATTQAALLTQEALGLWQQTPACGKADRAKAWLLLGRLAERKREWARAARHYETALQIAERPHLEPSQALSACLQLAALQLTVCMPTNALPYLVKAKRWAQTPEHRLELALLEAKTAQAEGQTPVALNLCELALAKSASLPASPRRLELFTLSALLRRDAARQGQTPWLSVLAKARAALALADSIQCPLGEGSIRRWQRQTQIACQCAVEACCALQDTLGAFFWSEAAKNRQLTPFLGGPQDIVQPSLPTLQNRLPQQGLVLEYLLSDDRIFVFALRPTGLSVLVQPCDTALLYQRVDRFFTACATRPVDMQGDRQAAYKTLLSDGEWLYTVLVKALIRPNDRRLVVVPDGVLHYVPFEALVIATHPSPERFDAHTWLGQRCAVHYQTSLSDLVRRPAKRLTGQGMLIMAPAFQEGAEGFRPLPGSRQEAILLDSLFDDARHYIGDLATRDLFCAEATRYRRLHLSTHGMADGRNPAYSFVAFAPSSSGMKLYATEITGMDLTGCDLVVLSACQTQFGRLSEGDGLLSLAWAFRQAGVPALVASLWDVADRRSVLLQGYFWAALRQGIPKNEALAAAKTRYLSEVNREMAHPFYWAGLQLLGDPAALEDLGSNGLQWFWVAGLALLGVAFGAWVLQTKKWKNGN